MTNTKPTHGRCSSSLMRKKFLNRQFVWSEHEEHSKCSYAGKDFEVPMIQVLKSALREYPLIAMDEDVLAGTPRVAGTRIPVSMILDAVQYYGTLNGAIESYPHLSEQQIKQAVGFAGLVMERPVEFKPKSFA